MQQDPKISIVIPVYNKGNYIGASIKSVLNQSFKEFELICVDDGSTDNSLDIIREINDSRIRLHKLSENKGVSVARNQGVALARADLIAFLDADDHWQTDHLSELTLLREKFPNCSLYGTSYMVDRNGKRFAGVSKGEKHQLLSAEQYFLRMRGGEIIRTSSIAVPKALFLKSGQFPVGISNGEDIDTWARLALEGHIGYSQKLTVIYYKDIPGQAISNTKRTKPIVTNTLALRRGDVSPSLKKAIEKYLSFYLAELFISGRISVDDLKRFKREFFDLPTIDRFLCFPFLSYSRVKFRTLRLYRNARFSRIIQNFFTVYGVSYFAISVDTKPKKLFKILLNKFTNG